MAADNSKAYAALGELFAKYLADNKDLTRDFMDLIPEADPLVDIRRIGKHAKAPGQTVMWIKRALAGSKGDDFRTAKNHVLVILLLAKPDLKTQFALIVKNSSKDDKNRWVLPDGISLSRNTALNLFGYFETARWWANIRFWESALGGKRDNEIDNMVRDF